MESSFEKDKVVVSLDLPAPPGWTKKFIPKEGGTPKKNEIIFTAPSGEKITNSRQLKQYLKSHPGSPATSEFDWGTGETPRRSARISEKAKTTPPTESEPLKKRSRKSSASKKDDREKEVPEETEVVKEVPMQEADVTEENAAADIEKDYVKENQNEEKDEIQDTEKDIEKVNQDEKKDETQDTDGKSEDALSNNEARLGKDVKMPDDPERSEQNAETEPEHPKEPQVRKVTDGSEVAHDEGVAEDAEVKEKVDQTPVETGEEDGRVEQEKPDASTDEKKWELEGGQKEENISSAAYQSNEKEKNLVNNDSSKKVEGEVTRQPW